MPNDTDSMCGRADELHAGQNECHTSGPGPTNASRAGLSEKYRVYGSAAAAAAAKGAGKARTWRLSRSLLGYAGGYEEPAPSTSHLSPPHRHLVFNLK